MQTTRPTGRYDKETGETIWYRDGEAPPEPGAAYTPSDGPVKVTVPAGLADRATAAGIPVITTVRAGALRALRDACREAEAPTEQDKTRNSAAAALARSQLGQEIQMVRKALDLSRAAFHWRVLRQLTVMDIPSGYGWGEAQVQQWEIGRSAPREIDPIILACEVGEETAERWRGWWATARRGIKERVIPAEKTAAEVEVPEMQDLDELEAEIAAQEAALAEKTQAALDRLGEP